MEEDKKKDPRGAAMVVIWIGLIDIVLGFTSLDRGTLQVVVVGIGVSCLLIGVFFLLRIPKKS